MHSDPQGDVPGWEQIVSEQSGRVYRLAYRLTGNPHDAEDLTQDVFIKVFRALANFEPGNIAGWLHRITTNEFLDQARRKQRIRMVDLPQDADNRLADGRLEDSPERAFEHRNMGDDIQTALAELSPQMRAAIVLRDMEDLSYEEISATLGISLGTVRSRIHRARATLRKKLAHRAADFVLPASQVSGEAQ
ncbi:MAG TPA: sigma-70 family RNA polymerase sigma factor [Actinomycetales bacterium]|nr:sigma-70 family RNA polymerase sigma factor [Actinomycetales bacterium]